LKIANKFHRKGVEIMYLICYVLMNGIFLHVGYDSSVNVPPCTYGRVNLLFNDSGEYMYEIFGHVQTYGTPRKVYLYMYTRKLGE
jgi:hypothetical protein